MLQFFQIMLQTLYGIRTSANCQFAVTAWCACQDLITITRDDCSVVHGEQVCLT